MLEMLPSKMQQILMLFSEFLVEDNLIDTVQVRGFISSAFTKSPKLEIFNYTLDKSDGDFLVALITE